MRLRLPQSTDRNRARATPRLVSGFSSLGDAFRHPRRRCVGRQLACFAIVVRRVASGFVQRGTDACPLAPKLALRTILGVQLGEMEVMEVTLLASLGDVGGEGLIAVWIDR